jgi:hypothetical protein
MVVTDVSGVRPSLDRTAAGSSAGADESDAAPPPQLPETSLLTAAQLGSFFGDRTWTERRTHANTKGSTDLLPCQREPYADPRGAEALVRDFSSTAAQQPRASAIQMTEASGTPRAARRTYQTLVEWYAGCNDERVQLVATRTVEQVGDQAIQFVLRSWDKPVTTMVVGVARSGLFTTSTVDAVAADLKPDVDASGRMLAAGVEGLCQLEGGGGCATDRPRLAFTTPVPVGDAPALLSEVDLPPVSGVDRPWAGAPPERVTTNMAATRCEDASFTGKYQGARFSNSLTRTFVIPDAGLPVEFGLTQTVASLPAKQAVAFVENVRTRLGDCGRRDLGTDVTLGARLSEEERAFTVWHLQTELSDKRSLTYTMAILRNGTSVAQLNFVQAPNVTMGPGDFEELTLRALDRLAELPRPRR